MLCKDDLFTHSIIPVLADIRKTSSIPMNSQNASTMLASILSFLSTLLAIRNLLQAEVNKDTYKG